LSDIERQFITQRLSEETAALQRLPQSDFPIYVSEPPRTSTGEHAH
jgi:hypothetical protein